ncbi:MAG: hypothetical protein IJU21_02335 [Bacteroidales bacterium]|nr:hypothetical protein [Bacteroidales bacterium]
MKLYRYLMAAVLMAAVLQGCRTRVDPYYPRDNQRPGGNQGNGQPSQPEDPQKDPELKENTTWQISYEGRKIVDGAYTEEIRVNNVPASQKYLVSVINKANYSTYGGDLMAFLKNELENNSEYVYQGAPEVIQFGRFRHGTWYAFVIGLDSNKKLTGEYAYTKFEVKEEEASAEYISWLGNWTVSDGHLSYNISITQEEANQVYRVDGWEVLEKPGEDWVQMDMENLEAFFEPSDGRLYFVSQYIWTYEDEDLDGDKVDEFFLGIIDYDGITEEMGLYIVPDEGIDLAYAQKDDDKAYIYPCNVSVNVGSDVFEGKFYCMQYLYQEVKNGNWHYYNQDSVSFFDNAGSFCPITMVSTKAGAAVPSRIVRRNGKIALTGEDKPLRGKVYQPREGRVVNAVKL